MPPQRGRGRGGGPPPRPPPPAPPDIAALGIDAWLALQTTLLDSERAEEVEQLNAANRRLLETLEDADGSMGGLTTGLQVRVRGAVCEGRDHKQRARERERRREGGRKRNGGKEGREECERKS